MRVNLMVLALGLMATPAFAFQSNLPAELSEETESCLECHKHDNPGLSTSSGASESTMAPMWAATSVTGPRRATRTCFETRITRTS